MPFAIQGEITGLADALKRLDAVGKKVKKKAVRSAVNHASKLLLREAKSRVPTRTGQLKKSLGRKVKAYPGAVVGIVGPRTGRRIQIGVRQRGNSAGTPIMIDPVKYAHLVEYGHGGRSPAPPHPFLRPAFDSSKWLIVTAMTNIIANAIEDAAKGGA